MEQLVMAIAIPLAKQYGMEKALEIAYERLGIAAPKQSKIDIFTGGGINQAFSPGNLTNMFKRGALRMGANTLMSGSSMGMALPLMAGGLGLAYLRNPLRQGSMNYNPYLKDQMTYLSKNNMIGTDQSGLTKYGGNSILSGQNVVSMFGTNDYLDQLNKYKDKYYDTMSDERKDKLDKEIADYELDQVNKELKADALKTLQNINAGNNDNNNTSTSTNTGKSTSKTGGHSGSGYQGASGSHHYRRGGIASL